MKNKSIIMLLILSLGLSITTTSCQDMLSSSNDRYSENPGQDTLYAYWGILKSLQNVAERYVILGECRGDLVNSGNPLFLSDSIRAIVNFGLDGSSSEMTRDGACRFLKVSDYYHVINSCNAYLASADSAKQTDTGKPYFSREMAQVEAIRGWVYLQLVINYGEVPFYLKPLLSTDAVTDFTQNSMVKANADNLADLLAPSLKAAYHTQDSLGYPSYNNIGYANQIHSSKTMIPAELVLADIYLLGNRYREAAEYYYRFLASDNKLGGILPYGYYSLGFLPDGASAPVLNTVRQPFSETTARKHDDESICCIPSMKNKLWGTVLTGVNDIFGYECDITFNDEDESTSTAVGCRPAFDRRQVGASAGYDSLCNRQDFEYYESETYTQYKTLLTYSGVGDARADWVKNINTNYNDKAVNDRWITKQNPNGNFSPVYPMIYRKSMVWLRFAEALNRAGFPGYAFAILRHGLCNNTQWLPTQESDYDYDTYTMAFHYTTYDGEGNIDKTYQCTSDTKQWPRTTEDVEAFWQEVLSACPEVASQADAPDSLDLLASFTYANWPKASGIACDYIPRRETLAKSSSMFLDFKSTYFEGTPLLTVTTSSNVHGSPMLVRNSITKFGNDKYAYGIHSRGCGMLEPGEKNSTYNYISQINKMRRMDLRSQGKSDAEIQDLTREQIYADENLSTVQQYIEDLILEEEGLELAFEGSRFFDILRVARRRTPDYMVKRIQSRYGSPDYAPSWVTNLSDQRNWYLRLPQGN